MLSTCLRDGGGDAEGWVVELEHDGEVFEWTVSVRGTPVAGGDGCHVETGRSCRGTDKVDVADIIDGHAHALESRLDIDERGGGGVVNAAHVVDAGTQPIAAQLRTRYAVIRVLSCLVQLVCLFPKQTQVGVSHVFGCACAIPVCHLYLDFFLVSKLIFHINE